MQKILQFLLGYRCENCINQKECYKKKYYRKLNNVNKNHVEQIINCKKYMKAG